MPSGPSIQGSDTGWSKLWQHFFFKIAHNICRSILSRRYGRQLKLPKFLSHINRIKETVHQNLHSTSAQPNRTVKFRKFLKSPFREEFFFSDLFFSLSNYLVLWFFFSKENTNKKSYLSRFVSRLEHCIHWLCPLYNTDSKKNLDLFIAMSKESIDKSRHRPITCVKMC